MKDKQWSFYSDEELMKWFCDGANEAFEELYKRYYSKLLYFILHSTAFIEDEAKDILQDVFLKLIEKKDSFDTDKKFSVWLYSITNNMYKNLLKYKSIRVKATKEALLQERSETPKVVGINQNKVVREALKIMRPIHKQVFILRFNFGFSIRETSIILEISEGTVKSRLHYCIQSLRRTEDIKELRY